MLGNDVVDLLDPDSRPESFRPRFDARVYSPEERRAISRDRNPLARRWAHWAAKEAAFKTMKQLDSKFVFSPSHLEVEFEPTRAGGGPRIVRNGRVCWTGAWTSLLAEVEVRSFETEERVHVIALPPGAEWGAVEYGVEALSEREPDSEAAVREFALREISRSLGVAQNRLRIGSRSGVPGAWRDFEGLELTRLRGLATIELDGAETSLSLSLSQHGRFIGYAMTPRTEAAFRGDRARHRAGDAWSRVSGTGALNP